MIHVYSLSDSVADPEILQRREPDLCFNLNILKMVSVDFGAISGSTRPSDPPKSATEIQPGDPKPLVTSQFPQKISIQITLHQRLQKRK